MAGNLAWLTEHQEKIEKKLFRFRHSDAPPTLFLHDVTSSYLEGSCNELAAHGYNRDRKSGKMQIVIGLLTDGDGTPVAARVFEGNTPDTKTVAEQVRTLQENFGVKETTLVGDRGMLKGPQIENLPEGFQYITAITKPRIRTLLSEGVFQMNLFDVRLGEVEHEGVRYVLKRNPVRAAEVCLSRNQRLEKLKEYVAELNQKLTDHPKASAETALAAARKKAQRYRLSGCTEIAALERELTLAVDEAALAEIAQLDGCHALKTDLKAAAADKETIHARYKDLARVERAFRSSKTAHLEPRPVYVRKEASTRGHVFVVMLAYLIVSELRRAWTAFDLTVEEGLRRLQSISAVDLRLNGGPGRLHIPQPTGEAAKLLAALDLRLPKLLPAAIGRVDTHNKLPRHRNSR